MHYSCIPPPRQLTIDLDKGIEGDHGEGCSRAAGVGPNLVHEVGATAVPERSNQVKVRCQCQCIKHSPRTQG